jgi:hypothetical protein
MVGAGTIDHHHVTALHRGSHRGSRDPHPYQETHMKRSTVLLAAIPAVALAVSALPLLADEAKTKTFVQMAEAQPDGKLPKSMVMNAIERKFDMADTNKEGKLDSQQTKQFQQFLKQFTRESGA